MNGVNGSMTVLRLKGKKVSSLEEFRQNFDFTNAKDYLRQGRLSRWVRDLGQAELADELDELKDADYSDQTLLDNLVGIFKLEISIVTLPTQDESDPGKEYLPVSVASAESVHEMPPVLDSTTEQEPYTGSDGPVFFSDSMICFKKSLAMINVEGNTPSAIQRYLGNMTVLKIICGIVPETLPSGLHEKYGYQHELEESSRFVADLGFDEAQLSELAQRLNDKFNVDALKFNVDEDNKILRYGHLFPFQTIGDLLGILKMQGLRLKSYTDDEASRLLDGEFKVCHH